MSIFKSSIDRKHIASVVILAFIFFSPSRLLPQQITHGAYIAPVIKYTSIMQHGAAIMGIKGGWIINESFVLGGAFYGLSSDIRSGWIDKKNGLSPFVKFNYGGLDLEYYLWHEGSATFSAEIMMGGAGINLKPKDESKPFSYFYGGNFLIFEPQVNAGFAVTNYLHCTLGISYRFTSGLEIFPPNPNNMWADLPDFQIKNLEGISAAVEFRFGAY